MATQTLDLSIDKPLQIAGTSPTPQPTPPTVPPGSVATSDLEGMARFMMTVPTFSGQPVTVERARRCSFFLAIARGLSEDIASLPLELVKMGPNGDEVVTDHPKSILMNRFPNSVHTPMEIREQMIWSLLLFGNSYNLIYEDQDGGLEAIWPLQSDLVTRLLPAMQWSYTDPTLGVSGTFTSDGVWRTSMLSMNGIDGYAIMLLAKEAIGLAIAAEIQAARLFSNGIQTDFALATDQELDEDGTNQLRKALMARHGGAANAFMPLILQGGLKPQRIGLTAVESQYLEARNFQGADIARVLRYPDVLLGGNTSGKAATYASAEQFFQSYTKHTLGPWATRIEQSANRDLLTSQERKRYYWRHNFDGLLRSDRPARFATYATGVAIGMLSPADCRHAEGLPYVEGLDYYTRPLNTAATAGQDADKIKPTDQSGGTITPEQVADMVGGRVVKEPGTGKTLYFPPPRRRASYYDSEDNQ